MNIKSIRVKNFKSFKDLEIKLGKFNVLIGANASGKSNFVQIFKFMKDIANHGLDNAVSMQGGVEYLRNINVGTSENFSLKIVYDEKYERTVKRTKESILLKEYETAYEFALKFKKRERGLGFNIDKDILTLKFNIVKLKKTEKNKDLEEIGDGKIIITYDNGKLNIDLNKPKGVQLDKYDILPPFAVSIINIIDMISPSDHLLLRTPFFFIASLEEIFKNISVYDFDPKLPKKATPITGKAELEEDGSNLPIVLKNIVEDKEKRRKLLNIVTDLLPFISDLDIEKFADKALFFKFQEIYFENQYLPASLMSDGSINIIALIIALYFEKKPLTIIEEPDRSIHPYLISKVVDMMKDASQNKQIIVTTHNPEMVKHTGLDSLLLVSRDEEGFSVVSRPNDKNEVKIFLENEIGIEELYVQNLLGV